MGRKKHLITIAPSVKMCLTRILNVAVVAKPVNLMRLIQKKLECFFFRFFKVSIFKLAKQLGWKKSKFPL